MLKKQVGTRTLHMSKCRKLPMLLTRQPRHYQIDGAGCLQQEEKRQVLQQLLDTANQVLITICVLRWRKDLCQQCMTSTRQKA